MIWFEIFFGNLHIHSFFWYFFGWCCCRRRLFVAKACAVVFTFAATLRFDHSACDIPPRSNPSASSTRCASTKTMLNNIAPRNDWDTASWSFESVLEAPRTSALDVRAAGGRFGVRMQHAANFFCLAEHASLASSKASHQLGGNEGLSRTPDGGYGRTPLCIHLFI